MKLWIRVDASLHRDPEVADLAARVGVKKAEAIGLLVCVWGAMAEHRPSGDVSDISPATLEDWAEYEPRGRVRRGAFAAAFLELFTDDGRVRGWKDRQGKLIERAEKDRIRKHGNAPEMTESSKDIPRSFHGTSAPTERDVTEQDVTETEPTNLSPRESFVRQLLKRVPEPQAWKAEISAMLEGAPGHHKATKAQIETAARDMLANGKTKYPNLRQFRRYVEGAQETPPSRNGRLSPMEQSMANTAKIFSEET